VLIKRGSEVGGGDLRSSVGTMAKILDYQAFADGRLMLLAIGTRRMWVEQWLADDPYPRAVIQYWPDVPAVVDPDLLDATKARLAEALRLAEQLGVRPDGPIDLSNDPAVASMQIAARAPLSPLDKQKLLRSPGAVRRLTFASALLDESIELLRFRLGLV
jgi:uncharacterized protein